MTKLKFSAGLIMVLFVLAFSLSARVQPAAAEYPERAISLVVPFPPGGVTDLGARAFADFMEKELKKPVTVVNKAGGSTTIGGNAVATAKPDGYTFGYFPSAASLPEAFSYFYEAPYSSKDLKPVCCVAGVVGAIVVKGDSPINSFKDLVEHIRKNPGAKWGVNGKTSSSYFMMKAIANAEKLNIVDVAFGGDVKIVPAILGDHIPVGSPTFPSVSSLVAAGQLKMVALVVDKREEFLPKAPTVVELGYTVPPGQTNSVFAPKGTPDAIIRKFADAAAKVSQNPAFRSKLMELGILPAFQNTKTFEASVAKEKEELQTFFRKEGLVK